MKKIKQPRSLDDVKTFRTLVREGSDVWLVEKPLAEDWGEERCRYECSDWLSPITVHKSKAGEPFYRLSAEFELPAILSQSHYLTLTDVTRAILLAMSVVKVKSFKFLPVSKKPTEPEVPIDFLLDKKLIEEHMSDVDTLRIVERIYRLSDDSLLNTLEIAADGVSVLALSDKSDKHWRISKSNLDGVTGLFTSRKALIASVTREVEREAASAAKVVN